MKKVIPFTTAIQNRIGPPAPQKPTGNAAIAASITWQEGSEQQIFLLLQRVIGCSDDQELITRFFRWAVDLSLADGLSYVSAKAGDSLKLGNRRHHSAQYELNLDSVALGSVSLCRRDRYSEDELLVIEQALGALSRCLIVAQEITALKSRATQDSLTGLGNRNSLNHWLKTELSRSRRHGSPLTMLMIDVDHFKAVNDCLGHVGGDRVLRAIADVFERSTRGSDLRFRYGGDEFAILLPHTTLEGAENAAAQIRANLARLSDEELGVASCADNVRPDISIGISAYEQGDDEESLVRRADTHLYHAKALGRGRVCSHL